MNCSSCDGRGFHFGIIANNECPYCCGSGQVVPAPVIHSDFVFAAKRKSASQSCQVCDLPISGEMIRVTMPDGKTYEFCCVACFKKWVESKGKS